jgi:hypothetical protein
MPPEIDPSQAAEMHDALDACDELRIVLSRLKRHGLLTAEENRRVGRNLAEIAATLEAKLPEEATEDH